MSNPQDNTFLPNRGWRAVVREGHPRAGEPVVFCLDTVQTSQRVVWGPDGVAEWVDDDVTHWSTSEPVVDASGDPVFLLEDRLTEVSARDIVLTPVAGPSAKR